MKKCLLVGSLLLINSIAAYSIEVSVVRRAGCTLGSVCDDLDAQVKQEIENGLPDASFGDYTTGMANSNSFAQVGLSSDYSDDFDVAAIKLAIGTAFQGDADKIADDPATAEGIGIGAAATFGINLDILPIDKIGFIDLTRMDLFVSLGMLDQNKDEDDLEIDGKINYFSVMGRYRLMDEVDIIPGNLLKWGGVHLHTGIQRSTFDAKFTKSFNDEVVDVGGGQTATITDTAAIFDINTTTTTIPVELSTYIRTIWALTFFGGGGFDFVSGSSKVKLNAVGTASGNGVSSSYISDITASESDSGDADPTNFRAFAGVQLNVPFVRLFLQANKGLGSDLNGLNFGAKILW